MIAIPNFVLSVPFVVKTVFALNHNCSVRFEVAQRRENFGAE